MLPKRSTLPLLGPALVLYLVADVASSTEGGLDGMAVFLAAVATGLALASVIALREVGEAGRLRVSLLGVALGVALATRLLVGTRSLAVEVAWVLSSALVGALVLDLALTLPDTLLVTRARRVGVWLAAAWAAGVGLLSVLPAFVFFDSWVLVGPGLADASAAFALVALVGALGARLWRRRLGSTPEALAASLLAELGLGVALVLGVVVAVAVDGFGVSRGGDVPRGVLAAIGVALLVGHAASIEPHRRASSGEVVRTTTSAVFALALTFGVAYVLARVVPHEPLALALVAVATLLVAAGVHVTVQPLVRAIMAPSGGRLLTGVDEALAALHPATSLEEIARAALPPLRRAVTRDPLPTAEPLLFALAPDRCASIDAAGEPHVATRSLPAPLLAALLAATGTVIPRGPLEARSVRRADERTLLDALRLVDAFVVVPLSSRGELEGALVVPTGTRRTALALEETLALEQLGRALAARLAILQAEARATERAKTALLARERDDDRAQAAEAEAARLGNDLRALAAGPDAARFVRPPVAYGEATRTLVARLRAVAAQDAPVLLVAPAGSEIVPLSHVLHAEGPRAPGPFLVADVAAMPAEDAEVALFGDAAGRPGLLPLAARGTLLIRDVPALPLAVQRALAEALAARQARPVGGTAGYAVEARLVLTSRLPVAALFAAGVLDSALAEWLAPLALDVPRLADRREDLPSLVLYALDRAARVLGRAPIGIEPTALAALSALSFPGDVEELFLVVERAVARAGGPKLTTADLPSGAGQSGPLPRDPLAGTWDDIERRALVHALERAGGNKSEAARLLDMKRTTFNDRARRLGLLEESATKPS